MEHVLLQGDYWNWSDYQKKEYYFSRRLKLCMEKVRNFGYGGGTKEWLK